ncbi:hypothetical protein AO269_19995 [Pseudomonas putida]|nr:hypothetical protein AO269_19995 [Pseudomonas putida]
MKRLEQRVAGHAIGAVQAGGAGLANGVQAGDVGAAMLIDQHAAAGVVRCGHHGNALAGDIDAEFQATLVHRREVTAHEVRRLVADVQVYAFGARALHLVVDGARDDIAWCQLCARIEARGTG